ncbi:hypothetical protein BJX66DRAFT_89818 [Aspergillus keveii]|uniref:Uncharacterized protein n=1 Tax=Aspergillus keveii TaxID=714993 RepID=A0ABR4FMK5_9EURO
MSISNCSSPASLHGSTFYSRCHQFCAYFRAVPYDVAWPISIGTPCYTKTEPLPVGMVPWFAHHRVSRRTPINIQAPLETLAHGSIRRDILVCSATAHSIPARKDLVRRAIVVTVDLEVAGVSYRAVGSSGTRWSRRGRGSGRGGGGGASDGAVPVLVVRTVWVLHAVRVARVQEIRVLLERVAGAEKACPASTTTSASASRLGRAGAEGQRRCLGRERDGAGPAAAWIR